MTDDTGSNGFSISVAKTIDSAMAAFFELASSEVVCKFDKLEENLLQKERKSIEILEIKRRVAEAKISILFEKIDAKSVFEDSWNDIESFGYSTREREATVLFYRA
jgi:hypothetical protein